MWRAPVTNPRKPGCSTLIVAAAGVVILMCAVIDSLTGIAGLAPRWPIIPRTMQVSSTVCGTWLVEPAPGMGFLSEPGDVTAVSVASSDSVWVVGHRHVLADNTAPSLLALHWNGIGWRITDVPSPTRNMIYSHLDLNNIAAIGKDDIWAIGSGYADGQTLIRHWDGSKWNASVSPKLPTSNNHLYGISAVSKDDIWVVGHANITKISYGIGTVVHTPMADEAETLIMHWDGQAWSTVAAPEVGGLNAVAAISADDVWAVGNSILHWDGSSWTKVADAQETLYAITFIDKDDVWAVGEGMLTMHWNGQAWTSVQASHPPTNRSYLAPPMDTLTSVAATAPDDVWAVGRRVGSIPDPQYPYRNVQNTIVQHWNGTTWSLVPSPNDSTTQNFVDVAAVSKDELWAVGGNDMGVLIARFRRAPCAGTPTAYVPTP